MLPGKTRATLSANSWPAMGWNIWHIYTKLILNLLLPVWQSVRDTVLCKPSSSQEPLLHQKGLWCRFPKGLPSPQGRKAPPTLLTRIPTAPRPHLDPATCEFYQPRGSGEANRLELGMEAKEVRIHSSESGFRIQDSLLILLH